MKSRRWMRAREQPPMVPEEQYGPWKGMQPPYTNPSAVPTDRYQRPPARSVRFRDVLAGFPSALVFLAGVWLLVNPFLIDHPVMATGDSAVWNDMLVGGVLAVLGGIRSVAPFATVWAAWITVVIGGWLIAAPYALGYRAPGDARAVTVNDVIIGAVVIALTLVGLLLTWRWRPQDDTGNAEEQS